MTANFFANARSVPDVNLVESNLSLMRHSIQRLLEIIFYGKFCNYIFIQSPSCLARRQRSDLSVFKSSCHLPTCLYHIRWRLHTIPYMLNFPYKQGSYEYQFFWSLVWPARELNRSLPFHLQMLYPLDHWSVKIQTLWFVILYFNDFTSSSVAASTTFC